MNWRAEEVGCQQAQNGGRDGWHSRPGEQRRQGVSRHKTEGGTAGTHGLESRGGRVSAGTKRREGQLALTDWRAEEAGCQQARNGGRDGWHSPTSTRTISGCCVSQWEPHLILHQ